jgi:hypothetical protein
MIRAAWFAEKIQMMCLSCPRIEHIVLEVRVLLDLLPAPQLFWTSVNLLALDIWLGSLQRPERP